MWKDMNKTDDLIYSPDASATRFLFYQGLNDINLFVEDEKKEYIYETIFQRLLCNEYNIKAIFGLGGKSEVKKHYEKFGESTDGIRNFYIVDGDFDRYLAADCMVNDKCFIYLKAYCIENYLIDEEACLSFAKGKLKKTIS